MQPIQAESWDSQELTKGFPAVPLDLLLALEKKFPNANPSIGESEQKIFARLGAYTVVEFLRLVYDSQNAQPEPEQQPIHPSNTFETPLY